jgi:hypothetical protein
VYANDERPRALCVMAPKQGVAIVVLGKALECCVEGRLLDFVAARVLEEELFSESCAGRKRAGINDLVGGGRRRHGVEKERGRPVGVPFVEGEPFEVNVASEPVPLTVEEQAIPHDEIWDPADEVLCRLEHASTLLLSWALSTWKR